MGAATKCPLVLALFAATAFLGSVNLTLADFLSSAAEEVLGGASGGFTFVSDIFGGEICSYRLDVFC